MIIVPLDSDRQCKESRRVCRTTQGASSSFVRIQQVLPAGLRWRETQESQRLQRFVALPRITYRRSPQSAGKHALGDRARKLDKGILITRFELPFNIWWYVSKLPFLLSPALTPQSGTCDNHIGMGVRYNAEKKKVGSYYSTPIYSFRCKCHLCDGWFEIQTDPKVGGFVLPARGNLGSHVSRPPQNTRYVVVSGARQKDEEWDPEENGGFAIHGTRSTNPFSPS